MSAPSESQQLHRGNPKVFVTTQWSVVVSAGKEGTEQALQALEQLCRTYWYPLYAYVRRQGKSPQDAQDLTQSFFERLLERGDVGKADRHRGRFRTFLLTALNRFLADAWDHARAEKRGGKVRHVPIQWDDAETRYGMEPLAPSTPETCYDRRWALTVLDQVLNQLQSNYALEGKQKLFDCLHPALQAAGTGHYYEQWGRELGMSAGAIKVAVHRLRKQYRALLRAHIQQTVDRPAEVDDELNYLISALSGQ